MLIRRAAIVAAAVIAALGLVGCQDQRQEPTRPPVSWTTAPISDDQHLAVLGAARAIDPCALVPRSTLESIGTVLTVEVDTPSSCAAELNSTEFGSKTRLNWSISVDRDPLASFEGAVESRIGDAVVFAERDGAEHAPDVLVHTCMGSARFPVTIGLFVQVSTPVADKPCAVLDSVLPGALDLLRAAPTMGTSPDTPESVVAGADPCAVLSRLGTTTPLAEQFVHGCVFDYQGSTIDLQYSYTGERIVAQGDPILVVNGHPGYDLRSITETYWYGAVLGPAIPSAGTVNSSLGPRVPVVKVMGRDPAVLREVLTRTAELFPAA
ncbi:hypothetical protein [Nocardia fluminea]|uniref:Uncharacterized protein n=1 Tax=Nocardia fluminea TaxID=134984 RepID=A0A2N3VFC8_9NOCA|nr:hypothetical protein [Nocardia fluminea]PKV80291.1 hypothetical protein ATK86_4714 [Nocardia fluminea]